MILSCPACNIRYRVEDTALADPAGRELRCANCGHQWRYVPNPTDTRTEPPPPAAPAAPASQNAPASPSVPVTPPAATTLPPPGPLVASPTPLPGSTPPTSGPATPAPAPTVAAPRGSRVGLGCLAVVVLLAIAIAGVVLARDRIVALWPQTSSFYRSVGLRLEPPGAGLQIGKPIPTRNGDTLVVEGDITNSTDTDRAVPRLRVILRDTAGKELAGKVIDPPASELEGGATAHFKTQFEHPSDAATGVAVTFTSGS
jgi:predicted Zn finger-like uncharacterized protein